MDQVKDFVRSANSSLETLELWTVDSGESLIKTVSGDNDQDSMDFPNLVELSLRCLVLLTLVFSQDQNYPNF